MSINGRPGGIRTHNCRIWSPELYQLELLTCIHHKLSNLRFLVHHMLATKLTIFIKLQFIRSCTLVLSSCIISSFTFSTCKRDNYCVILFFCHTKLLWLYSIISPITPAPTVRPPSLTANLNSFSIAMGAISSAIMLALSPGIIISTPSARESEPVISVVLKKN